MVQDKRDTGGRAGGQIDVRTAERAFAAVSRARNVMFRHANGPIREAGLTVSQFEVLEALSARGPLSVGEVGKAVYGTPGNVPVVISNLEREGMVTRRRSERDGRVTVVELTKAGRSRVEALYPKVLDSLHKDLSPLTQEEGRTLVVLLRKVIGAADAADR